MAVFRVHPLIMFYALADHAADRGRVLLHRDGDGDTASFMTGSAGEQEAGAENIHFYPVHDNLKNKMFFT